MIYVGIGGWTYEPWRGTFYPVGLAHAKELEYASHQLTSIEINSTYYGTQKAESFARWRDATPAGFVFSVKGARFITNRRVLAEAEPLIARFFASGVMTLQEKLGPVNWQFMPAKRYERDDFERFLKLLPQELHGRPIRHAVEVRHESFRTPEFMALLRDYGVAPVITDDEAFPQLPDVTTSFAYVRLRHCVQDVETGYTNEALKTWAQRARDWAEQQEPRSRDVFLYMINGFKPKAPIAAMALIRCLPPIGWHRADLIDLKPQPGDHGRQHATEFPK